jgi:hypothetical protein
MVVMHIPNGPTAEYRLVGSKSGLRLVRASYDLLTMVRDAGCASLRSRQTWRGDVCGEHSDRVRLGRSRASGLLTRVIAGSHLKPADRSEDNLDGHRPAPARWE